ncbi:PhnE/PtxC family ABC transporter permease [Rhodobacter calidifons]|uniref:PhnE/PtxC family ABC transporter permease n=1 Tax=Rhodobacter calidifons TaxID=2715277 RepID=UPI001F622C3B|nr:hypothetical protein [Rhodobacter calidifons]
MAGRSAVISCSKTAPDTSSNTRTQKELQLGRAAMNRVSTPPLAVLWSFAKVDADLSRILSAGPRVAEFLGRMVPPYPSVLPEILKGSAETLRIAVLGTLGAVILSVPLGILASETMAPPAVHRPLRTVLVLIRAVPLIAARYTIDSHLVTFAWREGFTGLVWQIERSPAA